MMTNDAMTIDPAYAAEPEHPDAAENQAFGFWLYLMSDLVLFAAIFATYAVLGKSYAGGPTGRELFDLPYVFVETMLLLFSSGTCGLAMLAMHRERKRAVLGLLAVTLLLGCGFIAMEIGEFHSMIADGNGPQRSAFLSSFFTLVGTHGLHVTFGIVWLVTMMVQVRMHGLIPENRRRLICLSMFWHFLDLIWVGVFTFVYLMGVLP